jgi:hypothetical protein
MSGAMALGLVLALACSSDPATPEARVRATLAALEAAAQARDVAALKDHVSESYSDAYGHDRRALGAMAMLELRGHRSVHLLTRVRAIEIGPSGEANVVAVVAMAGTPIAGAEALASLRADLYRFDLQMREEDGAYRLTRAEWRPATIAEF